MKVRDHMALTLAGAHFAHEGRRVSAMYERLGLSETRFWALVDRLIDTLEAEREYPAIVRRLKARRETLRARRSMARVS
jgi:hypothetical protein